MFGVSWKAAGLAFMLALPVGQVLASGLSRLGG